MKRVFTAVLVFCLLFLLLPINVAEYYDAGELAVRYIWIPFGGLAMLYFLTQPILSPHSYSSFFGDLRVVENIIFLLIASLVGTFLLFFLHKKYFNRKKN